MWSGPRNISTAMMRAWENRPDTVVVDEPLYAAYLARTGLDHPGRDDVLAAQPTSLDDAVAALSAPLPAGVTVHYAKHMAHHLDPTADAAWTDAFRNVLLIRDPREVVASYVRSREACEPDDIGLLQEQWLLRALGRRRASTSRSSTPPTSSATRRLTCAGSATGSASPSPTGCCPGRPDRATPTASGRRTGTTRCSPPPASSPTARGEVELSPHDAAVAEACRPAYDALRETTIRPR